MYQQVHPHSEVKRLLPGTAGAGRSLFQYTSQALIYKPCLLISVCNLQQQLLLLINCLPDLLNQKYTMGGEQGFDQGCHLYSWESWGWALKSNHLHEGALDVSKELNYYHFPRLPKNSQITESFLIPGKIHLIPPRKDRETIWKFLGYNFSCQVRQKTEEKKVLVIQSCSTLCHPINCSPPDSSVLGILQVRILEWVAIPFSRGFFPPRHRTPGLLHCGQILYSLSHQGNPEYFTKSHPSIMVCLSRVTEPLSVRWQSLWQPVLRRKM